MKIQYCIWPLISFVLMCIFPTGVGFSQYYYDPGIPDTVRLGDLITDVEGPPYEGSAVLPVIVFNDEYLAAMIIPLGWTAPLELDSGIFAGDREPYINDFGGFLFAPGTGLVIFGFGIPVGYPYCPPASDTLAYLYFSVQDTGFAFFDTCFPPGPAEYYLHFVDTLGNAINPYFEGPREYRILPYLPGDVNQDGQVNAGDAVFLINYLFRQGIPPDYPELGDVNGDCLINGSDVVYLINYLFRNGPAPEGGCVLL
jgi:hypothetical protein